MDWNTSSKLCTTDVGEYTVEYDFATGSWKWSLNKGSDGVVANGVADSEKAATIAAEEDYNDRKPIVLKTIAWVGLTGQVAGYIYRISRKEDGSYSLSKKELGDSHFYTVRMDLMSMSDAQQAATRHFRSMVTK